LREKYVTQGILVGVGFKLLILLAVACSPSTGEIEDTPPRTEVPAAATVAPTPEASTVEMTEDPQEPVSAPLEPLDPSPASPETHAEPAVAAARANLAKVLGLPEEEILVQLVEPVDWPDASLGCPEPDKMYAQVITAGYRVMLEAGGQNFEYHTGQGDSAVLCENSVLRIAPSKGMDPTVQDGWPNQPIGDDVIIEKPLFERKP
jgi:hypothetical protein